MTYSKSVTIWCDGDECMEWVQPGFASAKRVRSWARGKGWRTSLPGGEDYCPDCVKRGEHL